MPVQNRLIEVQKEIGKLLEEEAQLKEQFKLEQVDQFMKVTDWAGTQWMLVDFERPSPTGELKLWEDKFAEELSTLFEWEHESVSLTPEITLIKSDWEFFLRGKWPFLSEFAANCGLKVIISNLDETIDRLEKQRAALLELKTKLGK